MDSSNDVDFLLQGEEFGVTGVVGVEKEGVDRKKEGESTCGDHEQFPWKHGCAFAPKKAVADETSWDGCTDATDP